MRKYELEALVVQLQEKLQRANEAIQRRDKLGWRHSENALKWRGKWSMVKEENNALRKRQCKLEAQNADLQRKHDDMLSKLEALEALQWVNMQALRTAKRSAVWPEKATWG